MIGMGGGASGLFLNSGASEKTYVEELFSTSLYTGTGSAQTINNGIDLSGEGGMTWIKARTQPSVKDNILNDTVRGAGNALASNNNAGNTPSANNLSAFNSNGFSVGTGADVNENTYDYSSWSFRKAPGFFDIVTYTGTGSAQNISHSLGSIPGCILVKKYDGNDDWLVYHRGMDSNSPEDYALKLNTSGARFDQAIFWNDTAPTDSIFTVGGGDGANENNKNYVAYIFAGGESTADTARSVDFDGTGDYLTVDGPGALGTSTDFTMECWVYLDATSGNKRIFSADEGNYSTEATQIRIYDGAWEIYLGTIPGAGNRWYWTGGTVNKGQWYHVALVRNGSNSAFYVNGVLQSSTTTSYSATITKLVVAGGYGSENIDGKVSNARFVKGTAVYTSSFRPPTEPLTSITNTTLLCCNDSSTTGKTTGVTITASGDPTASPHSPFDDPAGFVFGDNEDQNLIKCGSYIGNGSQDPGLAVNLGWEPQWWLVKRNDAPENWFLLDSERGWVPGVNTDDEYLSPDTNAAEASYSFGNPNSTGFDVRNSNAYQNYNNVAYTYIAIRAQEE